MARFWHNLFLLQLPIQTYKWQRSQVSWGPWQTLARGPSSVLGQPSLCCSSCATIPRTVTMPQGRLTEKKKTWIFRSPTQKNQLCFHDFSRNAVLNYGSTLHTCVYQPHPSCMCILSYFARICLLWCSYIQFIWLMHGWGEHTVATCSADSLFVPIL